MAVMQKGNKQLRVPDEKVKSMLQNGFAEVDEKTGKVIREAKTDDLKALKKENKELKEENKELKEKIKALESELLAEKAQGQPQGGQQ